MRVDSGIYIKLIMFTKSQSCDRCFRQAPPNLAASQNQPKQIKKPESYLAKKFEELYDEDRKQRDKKKNKIQLISKQKQQKQIQGCTFKPEINNNADYYVNHDSFLKREEDWKRNIEKKLAEKRQQQSKKQKDSFSFQPKITQFPLGASQIKQGKSMNSANSYAAKSSFTEKRSYKVLHGERKKFKQITKATIVQPFKHRRMHTTYDGDHKLQNTVHSLQNSNKNENSSTLQQFSQSQKKQSQKLSSKLSIENHQEVQNHHELEKLNFEAETNQVEEAVNEVEVEEEEQGETF